MGSDFPLISIPQQPFRIYTISAITLYNQNSFGYLHYAEAGLKYFSLPSISVHQSFTFFRACFIISKDYHDGICLAVL